jgi:hypothetical protein
MRLLLRCAIFGVVYSLTIAALILFTTGWTSSAAFWLLYPAFRLGAALFAPVLDFDGGPTNFVALIVLSMFLNIIMSTGALLLLLKIESSLRRRGIGARGHESS